MTKDILGDAAAPLLLALNRLQTVQRYLHPAHLGALKAKIGETKAPLLAALAEFPTAGSAVEDGVRTALQLTLKAITAFGAVPDDPDGIFAAYRALRYLPYAMETLYPAAALSPRISAFYLEEFRHGDAEFLSRLRDARPGTGVTHIDNERGGKGGYSLYVPETYDPARRYPVIMALHGGAGHGRGFLWTWLREARSRGVIVISPTACGDTWALMEPDIDNDNLTAILENVGASWAVDKTRLMLTGMSDGGTFTYVSGLGSDSPFTHLAPISASFHPMMLEAIDRPNIAGRPIYLTHGVHDWMFDVAVARLANQVLRASGAEIVYREIPDLAHAYPRDENPRILDWFLG